VNASCRWMGETNCEAALVALWKRRRSRNSNRRRCATRQLRPLATLARQAHGRLGTTLHKHASPLTHAALQLVYPPPTAAIYGLQRTPSLHLPRLWANKVLVAVSAPHTAGLDKLPLFPGPVCRA
jgi:hypothetical protein